MTLHVLCVTNHSVTFRGMRTALGDVVVSIFLASAVFGEVGVSLFGQAYVGAAFGDVLGDSQNTEFLIFPYGEKSALRTNRLSFAISWSDHVRIMYQSSAIVI